MPQVELVSALRTYDVGLLGSSCKADILRTAAVDTCTCVLTNLYALDEVSVSCLLGCDYAILEPDLYLIAVCCRDELELEVNRSIYIVCGTVCPVEAVLA